MIKIVSIIGLAVLLAGCQSTETPRLISTKNVAVKIPDTLLNGCPNVPALPRTSTLTEIQTADLIRKLYGNNSKCYQTILQIRELNNEIAKTFDR